VSSAAQGSPESLGKSTVCVRATVISSSWVIVGLYFSSVFSPLNRHRDRPYLYEALNRPTPGVSDRRRQERWSARGTLTATMALNGKAWRRFARPILFGSWR
jgi:hypothetical protein